MKRINEKYIPLSLSIFALFMYFTADKPVPRFLNEWFGKRFLVWSPKFISLIENLSVSIIASAIFYYFMVYLSEKKQKRSLDNYLDKKIKLIYEELVGIAWELVAYNQLRGQGIEVSMGRHFISEWCKKTRLDDKDISIVENMYMHHKLAVKNSKEIIDIIMTNGALLDLELIDYLNEIANSRFDIPKILLENPQVLIALEAKIVNNYEMGESLKNYCQKTRNIKFD